MFSAQTVAYRKKLRAAISELFPKLSAEEIFDKLKQENNFYVTFDDLIPLFAKAEIPTEKFNYIFDPYQIRNKLISAKQFKKFFEDEFSPSAPQEDICGIVSDEHALILKVFASAIKARTAPQPSVRWAYMVSKNSPQFPSSSVRLACLCRLCDEYNLAFSTDDFIDAIFEFFGEKIDSLNFTQFSNLMSTFG